jgi:flagellar biosynthesis activator protein FlaF
MTLPPNPYQRAPELGNPARTEAWALLEAARELHRGKEGSLEIRRAALRRNWRLWTIFQANLLDPDCQVPPETRANLLGLADFIDRHTAELLVHGDPAKIDVLVNINRQISEGLLDGQRSTSVQVLTPSDPPSQVVQTI